MSHDIGEPTGRPTGGPTGGPTAGAGGGTSVGTRESAWAPQIPDDQWDTLEAVLREARAVGVECAFGGAFALAAYTGDLRNTKDVDLYILPEQRHAMVEAMFRAGLADYYPVAPYDRAWIFRAHAGDSIVDAIWAMANLRALVDRRWLTAGPEVELRGVRIRVIPAEELIWTKLYVLQRGRIDWPDVFNLLCVRAAALDWPHLLDRLDGDRPLLAGALAVFAWLAPTAARDVPTEVWERLGLAVPPAEADPQGGRGRADLLDSRPWFGAGGAGGRC